MTIAANELKTKGVSLLDTLFEKLDEVLISVRGNNKYVVLDMQRYNYLRECELLQALQETREDLRKGKSKTLTAQEHIEALERVL